MRKYTLKDYVNNSNFIEKMNLAFSDLRADYELSMDADHKKISELMATHVDVRNQLSNLVAYSISSSGIISGLRGTGKTHLMLLARHKINENCYEGKLNGVLCIYLNVKRLNIPENFNQEIFNRAFSIFMYNEISKQLTAVLERLKNQNILERAFAFFDPAQKNLRKNLETALTKLIEFRAIAHNGDAEFHSLSTGTMEEDDEIHNFLELTESLHNVLKLTGIEVGQDWSSHQLKELNKKLSKSNLYIKYLNTNTIREELIALMKMLGLKGITFFVDEWEKISYNCDLQRHLSFYIDRILDDPIYCWISVVPYRGSLYSLDNGADLQHYFNLDENLVYENSKKDRELCIDYFKKFINNRLRYYFNDPEINDMLLFNNSRNLEKLILASMGNSRDFGTMLLKCWAEFRAYRTSQLSPGRPYQYISEDMVIAAIKNNGEKKLSNINSNVNALKVWNDLESFCVSKKSSHLAIEETRNNIEAISSTEFSDLIYHRLLHLRKQHVPAKEISVENKLTIYALDYSSTFNLHSNEKRIRFITDYEAVHNRVRRYIYNPLVIINYLRIQAGELFPCSSCGNEINITKMAAAWSNNSCPFCGGKIRKD